MKRKDKGFSLIELIVVIALMAVAVTVSGYSLSYISLANAKNCATEIKSKLEAARAETTTRVKESPTVVLISADDEGVYYHIGGTEGYTVKKIGNSTINVKCDGTELKSISDPSQNEGIQFIYDKASGAFKTVGCNKMTVSSGGRTYTLTFYQATGKIKME